MPRPIHILLPVHNRRAVTERFVHCLKKQTYADSRLLLIDDGSTDGTAEAVRALLPASECLKGDGNLWWAGSLQAGFDRLDEERLDPDDIILLINDDTEFGEDFLAIGAGLLDRNPRALVMATPHDARTGEVIERDGAVRMDWPGFGMRFGVPSEEADLLSTRGLFLRERDRREVGGFHPRLLPHNYSDYEWTWRAKRKGLRLIVAPELKVLMTRAPDPLDPSLPFGRLVRLMFSNKSARDPLMLSAFALLAIPWPWKITGLVRVWKGAAAYLLSLSYDKMTRR